MGYAFHVTRRTNWSDEAGDHITPDEWLALASSRADLVPVSRVRIGGEQELRFPDEWRTHQWVKHPEHRPEGPTFKLVSGNLDFGGGEPATLKMAMALAEALRARIVGDEGEEYTLEEQIGRAADPFYRPPNPLTGEPLYKQREGTIRASGDELELVSARSKLLGFGSSEQRTLLFFIAPFPTGKLEGAKMQVRGTVSEPGRYGRDGACTEVFYVDAVLSLRLAD